jgi:hypothetical protein
LPVDPEISLALAMATNILRVTNRVSRTTLARPTSARKGLRANLAVGVVHREPSFTLY